ncbi:ABC transporter substrate-binding protein [Tsukamurella soli]|uniref:ABC transporter substrate-binding protein n=1 Tax=Tsukamurella soli TaxID=644556 RepID=A0ABP8JTJ0_9ACTN
MTLRYRRLGAMVVLTLAAGSSVAACGGAQSSQAQSSAGAVSAACQAAQQANPTVVGKKYKVGNSPTIPGYESPDANDPDKIVGFDVDLMNAISECAGFTYSFVKSDFQNLVPSLQAGRLDMVISNLIASPARAQQVDFVVYQQDQEALLVKHGNPKNITDVAALCGNSVAVFPGTVQAGAAQQQSDACVAAGKKPIEVQTYTDFNGCVQAVITGRSDATIDPVSVVAQTVQKFPAQLSGTAPIPEFRSAIGIALPKSSTEVRAAVLAATKAVQDAGTEKGLFVKWKQDPGNQSAAVTLP